MTRHHSTDVQLSCPCSTCNGASVRITARRLKYLCRLTSPAHEQAIHKTVTRGLAAAARDAAG